MAELVAKLSERLGPKPAPAKAREEKEKGALAPNRDRLTVGVDLGEMRRDKPAWSSDGRNHTGKE
jgi:hypothetical protein